MHIDYKNKAIEKICTNASYAIKKHGMQMAEKIQLRIKQIKASDSVEQMVQYKIGRCHPLHGNRENQYAVDLIHPYRLVFEKNGSDIQVLVIEITDYH